jgi:phage FluMu gp28-like protein
MIVPKISKTQTKKTDSQYVRESRERAVKKDLYNNTIDNIGGIEKIKDIFSDVRTFAKKLLGIDLYEYQTKILLDPSPQICICAGRRTGKTTVASIMGLHFALTHNNTNVIIVSPTQRQSNIVMSYIKGMIRNSLLVSMLIEKDISEEVWFKNGSRIMSLPSGVDGRTIRGITSHMIIFDEAAFMPQIIFDVVLPSIIASKDYKIILISTPNTENGYFFNATKTWKSYYHISTEDCPNINKEFLEQEKGRLDPYTYAREYEAKFISSSDSYFPLPVIAKSFQPGIDKKSYPFYTIGVDIGRSGSKCCMIVLGYDGDSYFGKQIVYDNSKTIMQFAEDIKNASEKYSPLFINIDTTGLGNALYELLVNEGVRNLKSCVLTTQFKNKMLSNLRTLFEYGNVKLPIDWDIVKEQLMDIKISLDPLRSPKTSEQDAVVSLGLATFSETKKRTVGTFVLN